MKTYKLLIIISCLISVACTKDFLDKKPSSDLTIPATLDSFESLLEGNTFTFATSALPILSSDEYNYISYYAWQSAATATERNSYIWEKDIYNGASKVDDWAAPYAAIFYANNILEGLENMEPADKYTAQWKFIKGWALFERAYYFHDLARNFCKTYQRSTATTDLGLPLKLTPDISAVQKRSSLEQTYAQILSDLSVAADCLESSVPASRRNRPSLPAVFGLQARVLLTMNEYTKAESAADSCLARYSAILDYRNLSQSSSFPFDKANIETIFTTSTTNAYLASSSLINPYISVDPELLALYSANDLRLKLFFKVNEGRIVLNGNYSGQNLFPFTGLATDEVYLIKAECCARRGDVATSMNILNAILVLRFPRADFTPATAGDKNEALEVVLRERRKELIWRGLRWSDLKRLNAEGAAITLHRTLGDKQYTLPPNDPRYVFPIPVDEIILSRIEQNPR